MLRQVGIGAAAVLTAGLLAVGCSEDGDTIVGSNGGSDLNNNDNVNATSVASNNLAPDGGGLSPDSVNANTGAMKVSFSANHSMSDGTDGSDGSAMVVFQVTDGQSGTNIFRQFATHFNGSTFTPPTELKFRDRNETVSWGSGAAVSMVYVSTGQYTAATGANADQVNNTRANDGNWYIMLDFTTFFNDPRNSVSQTPPTNTVGPHRALGLVVFVKSLRDQAAAVSTKVGAVSQNFFYGFQEYGTEVNVARSGLIQGNFTAGDPVTLTGLGTVSAPNRPVPPCDVTSFGFVSDGFAGQTSYGSQALPLDAGVNATANNAAAYTFARPNTNNAAFNGSSYLCGEVTNFVGIVYTQVVSSIGTGGAGSTINGNGALYGADLKAFFVPVNLHNNAIGTQVELNPSTARNPATGLQSCGTAFYPEFHSYNQHVFVKYADASLSINTGSGLALDQHALQPTAGNGFHDWAQAETFGHAGKTIVPGAGRPGFYEDIIARFRVVNNGDGTCSIATGQQLRDHTFFGTNEQHDITNPTISATGAASDVDVYPNNREMQNFNGAGQFIFGADEGCLDTVMFFAAAFNSGSATSPTTSVAASAGANIDRQLVAIGINDQDGLKLASAANQNPRLLSSHAADFHAQLQRQAAVGLPGATPGGLAGELRDPVEITNLAGNNVDGGVGSGSGATPAASTRPNFFETAMARTGEYITVGYIQNVGVSSATGSAGSYHSALFALTYQTQRALTQAGVGSNVNFDIRFSTGAPVQLSQTFAVTLRTLGGGTTGNADAAQTRERWNSLPVNSFAFQGSLGYRCGLQGNIENMNVLWEQSDETEDRLFVGQLRVVINTTSGTPALTIANRLELEPTANVSGNANYQDPAVSTGRTTSFRLINQDVSPVFTKTLSADAGDDADSETTVTAADGGILVIYTKCIDNTTSDNDHADAAVVVQVYNGTTAESSIVSESFNENAPTVNATGNFTTTVTGFTSRNGPMVYGTANGNFRAGVAGLVATGQNVSLSVTDLAARSEPATAHYLYIYGQRSDNSSSPRALFTRKHQPRNTASFTASAIGDRMIPVSTTGTTFREPTRIDHLQGQNVRSGPATTGVQDLLQIIQKGAVVAVFFFQDGHVWVQTSSDGVTYLNTVAGSPNPALVDNDTTSNVTGFRVDRRDDGSCGVSSAILFFTKPDAGNTAGTGGDIRLRARTGIF
jgi:hypothetical protein